MERQAKKGKSRWKWAKPLTKYTPDEKLRILEKALQIQYYHVQSPLLQKERVNIQAEERGSHRLRATGSLARLTMDIWYERFKEITDRLGIPIHL